MLQALVISAVLIHPPAAPRELHRITPVQVAARVRAEIRAEKRRVERAHRRAERAAAARRARAAARISPENMPGNIPAVWQAVAACESSGNWADTAGSFSGGLQFSASTWTSFDVDGYAPTAAQATPLEQVTVARRVLARQGVGAWPVCGPRAGLAAGD